MTTCKRCGKENQSHYKFCLGCGGELPSEPQMAAPRPVPVVPPMAGNTPPLGVAAALPVPPPVAAPPPRSLTADWAIQDLPPARPGTLDPLPGAAAYPASAYTDPTSIGGGVSPKPIPQAGFQPTPAVTPAAVRAPSPAVVPLASSPAFSSAPSFPSGPAPGVTPFQPYVPPAAASELTPAPPAVLFKPVAAPAPVTATPIASTAAAKAPAPAPAPAASAAARACPSCATMVPNEFAFCGTCGNRLGPVGAPAAQPASTMFMHSVSPPAAAVKPRGKMVLIRPDGSEGDVFPLNEGENLIGRSAGPLFEQDGYLSPRHAQIVLNAAGCVVMDTASLNGVYVKMTKEEPLESGDIFRIGQELLRFDLLPPPTPLEDGTEIMGSPNPGYWGRVSLVIGRDIDGNAWPLLGDGVALGRERGDINFPDDGYVSGLHARLAMTNGRVTLLDMNSSNGTFLRIRNQRQIETGTLVQFGQQLFRVQLG